MTGGNGRNVFRDNSFFFKRNFPLGKVGTGVINMCSVLRIIFKSITLIHFIHCISENAHTDKPLVKLMACHF